MDFRFVYIREAHRSDVLLTPVPVVPAKTMEERRATAGHCVAALGLGMPVLVDDMEDTVATAYAASPFRLVLLAPGGEIVWANDQGRARYQVDDLDAALTLYLGPRHGEPR